MRARHNISTLEPTRYEIVATKGSEHFTIAFTRGTSRASLLAAMRRQADAIIQRCEVGEDDQMTFGFEKRGSTSFAYATLANGWRIGFTGRTEREASAANAGAPPSAPEQSLPLSDATEDPGDANGSG